MINGPIILLSNFFKTPYIFSLPKSRYDYTFDVLMAYLMLLMMTMMVMMMMMMAMTVNMRMATTLLTVYVT